MTINYTSLLKLAKPVTGTESGTWGDTVNDAITSPLDVAVAGAVSIDVTSGNVTLSNNDGSGSNQARYAILLVIGTPGVSRNIIGPGTSKIYLVKNSSNGDIVVKASATTGVTIPVNTEASVFWNGSDYEIVGMQGPSLSTDNAVVRFDGTTGKVVQNSVVTIADSTGDVAGVGALTMGGNLTLNGGTANGVLYLNGSKVATSGSALTFDGTNFATTGTASATKFIPTGGTATGNGMYLPTSNELAWSNNGSETMRLTSTGLGIGTSSPGYKLDVSNGNVSGAKLFKFTGATAGGSLFGYSDSGGVGITRTDPYNAMVYFNTSNGIELYTGGAIRLTLDSSGNLGIGVTPSAWASGMKVLQFANGATVGSLSATYALFAQNYYYDGTNNIYLTTNPASLYVQNNGQHQWFIAPSGTAGNAITFTQAMTLDASGRLLVGNTSAQTTLTKTIELSSAGISTSQPAYQVYSFSGNVNPDNCGYFQFFRSGSSNLGTSTLVASGDRLGMVRFAGANGSDYTPAAEIYAEVDGTPGASSDMPGRLIFATTADGAGNTTERARITSGGNLQISSGGSFQVGGTAARATTAGTNRVDIFNGTAPVGTLTNGISLYSSSGEAYVMDAAGNATLFSPHDAETNEWVFKSKHTPTGKVLKIDVEKLLRFVNDHFGLDAVHEFVES